MASACHPAPGVYCADAQIRKISPKNGLCAILCRSGSVLLPVEDCFVDGSSHCYHSNMVFVYLHIFTCIKLHIISVIYVFFVYIFFLKPILINVSVGQYALTRGWEVGQQGLQKIPYSLPLPPYTCTHARAHVHTFYNLAPLPW